MLEAIEISTIIYFLFIASRIFCSPGPIKNCNTTEQKKMESFQTHLQNKKFQSFIRMLQAWLIKKIFHALRFL
jgi:hypothetical protein